MSGSRELTTLETSLQMALPRSIATIATSSTLSSQQAPEDLLRLCRHSISLSSMSSCLTHLQGSHVLRNTVTIAPEPSTKEALGIIDIDALEADI
jgi:hypothetical protein